MRGGALFQIAWGLLLAAFLVGCWIWTDDGIQTAEFGFAVAVTFGGAGLVIARGRGQALRRGEPAPVPGPEAIPSSSLGAVFAAIGFASVLFGFTWGRFLIFFGGGLFVVAAGMLVIELRQQRRAVRRWSEQEREPR